MVAVMDDTDRFTAQVILDRYYCDVVEMSD
jgi:hypothetical protein